MMNCKHDKNVAVKAPHVTHIFREGTLTLSSPSAPEDIEPTVRVYCYDCGLDQNYNLARQDCPIWVQALVARVPLSETHVLTPAQEEVG